MELGVFESPGKEWDEFALQHTDLIFYQSIWSEVLKRGLGGQPLYFCLRQGGEIVAGLPGVLLNFKLFKILYASIPYGHLIGEKSHYPAFLELLEKEFRRRGIDQVRLTESPFCESHTPAFFKVIPTKCTLLDLRRTEKKKIWEGYRKNIRRDVRIAQKSGVTVHSLNSETDVHILYELYLASMVRNKAMAKYPLRWFEAIHEIITQKEFGAFLIAEWRGTPIAGVVLIYSPSSTHYFHNGSRHEFLRYCPNELLVHSSIEKAIDKNLSFFDFMGSDPEDLSLLRFKEKWGSQSLDLHTYVRDYHPFRSKIWELGKRFAASNVGSKAMRLIRR